jgi:predicted O-linked N-acetylglucosamine transferase (SPINDLY family)
MIIFCNRIPYYQTACSYRVLSELYTQSGFDFRAAVFLDAESLDRYLRLQQGDATPFLLQFEALGKDALQKIQQEEALVVYSHADPRQALGNAITDSQDTITQAVAEQLQCQPQVWLPLAHRVIELKERDIRETPLVQIEALAQAVGLTFNGQEYPIEKLLEFPTESAPWQECFTKEEQLLVHGLFKPLLLFGGDETGETFREIFLNLVKEIHWQTWLDLLATLQQDLWKILPDQRELVYQEIKNSLIGSFADYGLAKQGAEIAHYLGNQFTHQGHFALAESWYLKAIELDSQRAQSYYNLGVAKEKQQQWEAAISYYRQAIAFNLQYAKAYYRLGLNLKQQLINDGANIEAENKQKITEEIDKCFTQVLSLEPNHPSIKFQLAKFWQDQGESTKAKSLLTAKEWDLLPDFVAYLINTGNRWERRKKFTQAQNCYEMALEFDPLAIEPLFNLALIFEKQEKLPEAIAYYRQVLTLDLNYIPALQNCGMVLEKIGYVHEAIGYYQKILTIDNDHPSALTSLATCAEKLGKIASAVEYSHKILQLEPHNSINHSFLLWCFGALTIVSPQDILDSSYLWHIYHVVKQGLPTLKYHQRQPNPDRPLRIGYISPDFRRHSCSFFIKPLLENHHHDQFEIYAYAEVAKGDQITEKIQASCDHWRCTVGLSDLEVAALIQADQIDILVDLAGHTAGNRLKVLGMKPAPIQATYLGYFATTGLPTIDYWITDEALHPSDTPELTSETIWRLPRCYLTYENYLDTPAVSPLPFEKTGLITFGSFNNTRKVTPETLDVWCEILKAVPNSRLFLKAIHQAGGDPRVQENIINDFAQRGISADRLFIQGKFLDDQAHFLSYNNVDIHLDPFPYGGCTTTCEALWMGVPSLTLAGGRNLERLSVTVLKAVGLEEWIADTPADYVQKAVRFAQDTGYLANLRATMRDRLAQSELLDAKGMAVAMEAAYRQMWHIYLDKQNQVESLPLPVVPEEDSAAYYHQLGREKTLTGELELAKNFYLQAINIDPTYAKSYHNLGFLAAQQGQLQEAINYYQQAIQSQPDYPVAFYNLGLVYERLEETEKAINCYSHSVQLDSTKVEVYKSLAQLYDRQENYPKAEKYYRCALLLESNNLELRYNLGVVLYEQKKFDKAESCFQKIIQVKPQDAIAYLHLGISYKEQKRLTKAKSSFEKAIELDPDYAMAHYNLGVVYSRQPDQKKAIDCFRQALRCDPENKLAHTALLFTLSSVEEISSKEIYEASSRWYRNKIKT